MRLRELLLLVLLATPLAAQNVTVRSGRVAAGSAPLTGPELTYSRRTLAQTLRSHLIMLRGLLRAARALIYQAGVPRLPRPNPNRFNRQMDRAAIDEKEYLITEAAVDTLPGISTSGLETLKRQVTATRVTLGKVITRLNTVVRGVNATSAQYWTQPPDLPSPHTISLHPASPLEASQLLQALPFLSFDSGFQKLLWVPSNYQLQRP
jgi:hypothetical protein